ncbi:MAG: LysM peptidoglycan-binding domain-containing protein [Bacteroidota bacterium]
MAKLYNLRDAFGNISTAELMRLNGLQGNTISVGQVLKIPK